MEGMYTRVMKRSFTLVLFAVVAPYESEASPLGAICLTFYYCFLVVASMARLLESQESQSRLIREYERTRERTASQAMNE